MDYKTCETCIGKECPYNKECKEKQEAEWQKALEGLKKNFWEMVNNR